MLGVLVGGNPAPSSLLPLLPPKNVSSIHSSPALPDFNFAINQQNKQTSGRKGGKEREEGRGWGRGAKDEVFSVAIALQTKAAAMRAPG